MAHLRSVITETIVKFKALNYVALEKTYDPSFIFFFKLIQSYTFLSF